MAERKRIGVPISGLDTSTPDHSVVDGKCETLHNLRYTGEAWRNVNGFEQHPNLTQTDVLNNYTDIHIVYKHPADVDGAYIVQATSDNEISIFRAEYSPTEQTWAYSVIASLGSSETNYTYSHFGNMLIVGYPTAKKYSYFLLWKNQTYRNITTVDKQIELSFELGTPKVSNDWKVSNDSCQEYIFSNTASSEVSMSSIQDSYIRGELALIATIELESGDEIYRSTPIIINTAQVDISSYQEWLGYAKTQNEGFGYSPLQIFANKDFADGVTITYAADGLISFASNGNTQAETDIKDNGFPCSRLYQPIVNIAIKRDAINLIMENTPLKLKIWATGVHPLFDIPRLQEAAESIRNEEYEMPGSVGYLRKIYPSKIYEWFSDNNIFNQPFYLLKSFDIPSFSENVWEKKITLRGSDFEKIIHQTEYLDTMSYLDLYSDHAVEINNRLHLIAPYNKLNNINDINLIEGDYYEFIGLRSVDSTLAKIAKQYANQQGFFLTAPSRISKLFFYRKLGREFYKPYSFRMTTSNSLVLATYINRVKEGDDVDDEIGSKPYRDIEVYRDGFEEINVRPSLLSFNNEEGDSNRIQVSTLNSNLNFEYKESYRIGSQNNHIITINSVAIEVSDTKFGEFPVYVFTTEGIFAMQSGKDTLYSAIVPINYDVIINPNTLAVNGAVLYFTDKGLHALTNQGAKLLSAPMHTAENRIPEWMYTTQMVYLPEWNEVLCTDLPNKKAYVFSLDSNVWSTRDIPEGYILNNDELVGSNTIYNLRDEQNLLSDNLMPVATRMAKSATNTYKHTWSCDWGVLDTNMTGTSTNYMSIDYLGTNRFLYRVGDNPDYFKDKGLYYTTDPEYLTVKYDDLILVSETNPLSTYKEVGELLIIHKPTGAVISRLHRSGSHSTSSDANGAYWYCWYAFDTMDEMMANVKTYGYKNAVVINDKTYYEWVASDDSGKIEVMEEWFDIYGPTFQISDGQTIFYNGTYNDLYYMFAQPLQVGESQPTPSIYCLTDEKIYLANNWNNVVTYSVEVITEGGDDNEGDNSGNEGGESGDGNEGGDTGGGNEGDDEDNIVTYNPMRISLSTRPIKLGSMELKRAETIIVRFECPTEQTLNVEVEGSIDTQNWKTLRKLEGVQTNKDVLIRRTPCSVKYLRFTIDGNVTDDIRILAFEIEYYNRWMRKMR